MILPGSIARSHIESEHVPSVPRSQEQQVALRYEKSGEVGSPNCTICEPFDLSSPPASENGE